MLIDKKLAEEKVYAIISKYDDNKSKQAVVDLMMKKGFTSGYVNRIYNKNLPLETLKNEVLCLFVICLYNVTMNEEISPIYIFNDNEINIAKNYQHKEEEFLKFPLVFDEVIEGGNNKDQWVVSLSIPEIVALFESGLVIYNPETQRAMKTKIYNDKIVSIPDKNPKKVFEMSENILKNKQIPDTITINIQYGEEELEEFEYDPKNHRLIIKKATLAITDGWNRVNGMFTAYGKNKEAKLNEWVMFTHFETQKAKDFIEQINKQTPVKEPYIKSISDSVPSRIINRIGESTYLRNKITTDYKYIKTGEALVMFDKLYDTLKLTFNPQKESEIIYTSKFIIDGFNTLIENHPNIIDKSPEAVWIIALVKLYQLHLNGKPATNLEINVDKIEYKPIKITKSIIKDILESRYDNV